MAYPFPRFASAPQTPQSLKGIESPSSAHLRGLDKSKSHATRWLIAFCGALIIVALFWLRSRVYQPRQLDRIPFSHTDVDEYELQSPGFRDSTDIANHL